MKEFDYEIAILYLKYIYYSYEKQNKIAMFMYKHTRYFVPNIYFASKKEMAINKSKKKANQKAK